jgi:hypothetical protein
MTTLGSPLIGKSRIGIVTAASEDPQGSADFYLEHFSALGAQVFWIPVHLDNLGAASDPDVVQEVYLLAQTVYILFGCAIHISAVCSESS